MVSIWVNYNYSGFGKIWSHFWGVFLGKYFHEIQTLLIQTPYRKLEAEGSPLGKRALRIKENDW